MRPGRIHDKFADSYMNSTRINLDSNRETPATQTQQLFGRPAALVDVDWDFEVFDGIFGPEIELGSYAKMFRWNAVPTLQYHPCGQR